jgi:hypothetical protein
VDGTAVAVDGAFFQARSYSGEPTIHEGGNCLLGGHDEGAFLDFVKLLGKEGFSGFLRLERFAVVLAFAVWADAAPFDTVADLPVSGRSGSDAAARHRGPPGT